MFSLASAVALTAVLSDPADARTRRGKRANTATATSSYSPAYAAIVVDANTGATMHAASADAIRHPASLTKIMTLYMLFERLESGKLTLESQLRVSEHAADQAPTKLGLREGSTISVEDAIKGLITRSANDAAAVVAENLAGSEEEFARQMTRKARALGMNNTTYRNASGLPDSAQVTTARDQATLGRAIQERFPRYYKYFATRSFTFRGQRISNHNRLLGSVDGVDGIKTGYIRASGFNLVTSVKRKGRHVVAVVLGGTSAGARDARMRQLLAQHVDSASTRKTAPMVAEAPVRETPAPRAAARQDSPAADRFEMASAASAPARSETPRGFAPTAGSTDPIKPVAVRTVSVKPPAKSAKAAPSAAPVAAPAAAPTAAPAAAPTTVAAAAPPAPQPEAQPPAAARAEATPPPPPAPAPLARAGFLGVLPQRTATVTETPPAPAFAAVPARPEPAPVREAAAPQREATPPATPPAAVAVPSARPQTRSGWVIQVGAYPAESEAKERLALAKSKAARLLASASPFTEPVQKGETTLYRARFAGFEREQAEAACKFLKRNDVDCLAVRN